MSVSDDFAAKRDRRWDETLVERFYLNMVSQTYKNNAFPFWKAFNHAARWKQPISHIFSVSGTYARAEFFNSFLIFNRSSSDDSSVDSFDSDSGGPSSTDNQNDFSNGWNGSQVESGFEDDFDRISTPSSSDPWSDSKADPFSPQRRIAPSHSMEGSGNSNNKFDISNDDPKSKKHILSSPSIFKPTVIRPSIPIFESKSGYSSSFKNDDDSIDGSPPMPSIPPPPPPPEVLEVLAHGPPIPPRPAKSYVSSPIYNYKIIGFS